MKKILFILACLPMLVFSQQRVLGPYLQNADTTSMVVMWETTFSTASKLSFGLTPELGIEATGSAISSFLLSELHTVKIEDLAPNTKYYYSVNFGNYYSDTLSFKTSPLPNDEESYAFVAFSDVQKDLAQPNKFREIIRDGVLEYVENTDGNELSDKLAYVLVPGDLVDLGFLYTSWKGDFFEPGKQLFEMVPLYPVLGNHEVNTDYFFKYFDLPMNGTDGYMEHWWYKDYSNTRIIGMDSNLDFIAGNNGKQKQLDWLEEVLEDACANDDIDFVFAQIHHPYRSELWVPGELDYSGDVIEQLENFSSNCGKPSIKFFGHTHGYARGQSKDHQHLMVNVASAGGALDKWDVGDRDYEEYSVGTSDYGFVYLEVEAGDEPKFTLKRISRGSPGNILDNVLRDSIVVYKNNNNPTKPIPIKPIDVNISADCIELEANLFQSEENGTLHGQSQWQVATHCDSFDNPIVDIWKNHQNWYFDEDLQANDDLTDQEITGLDGNTDYCWRVRYRDRNLRWSEWSDPVSFTTKEPINLLKNPGAENGIEDWIVTQGAMESLASGECDGTTPYKGSKYFVVGGACQGYANAKAHQEVDVTGYTELIDLGDKIVYFGGYLSDFNGFDKAEFRLSFLDDTGNNLGQTPKYAHNQPFWKSFDKQAVIPTGTRKIKFELFGTRGIFGTANDSYFDELYLVVDSIQGRIDTTVCFGETVTIFDTELSEEGTYILADNNSDDCLNQYEVNVSFFEVDSIEIAESICDGDSILFNGVYYSEEGSYSTTLSNENGCDSVVTLEVALLPSDNSACVTGLNQQLNDNLKGVYPNPFINGTTVSLKESPTGQLTLKVYNEIGELVREQNNIVTKDVNISRGDLVAGVYFFTFELDNQMYTRGSFVVKDK